jgi:hypothetical protein
MRSGWFLESHRHSLAAQGITTVPKQYFARGGFLTQFIDERRAQKARVARGVTFDYANAARLRGLAARTPLSKSEELTKESLMIEQRLSADAKRKLMLAQYGEMIEQKYGLEPGVLQGAKYMTDESAKNAVTAMGAVLNNMSPQEAEVLRRDMAPWFVIVNSLPEVEYVVSSDGRISPQPSRDLDAVKTSKGFAGQLSSMVDNRVGGKAASVERTRESPVTVGSEVYKEEPAPTLSLEALQSLLNVKKKDSDAKYRAGKSYFYSVLSQELKAKRELQLQRGLHEEGIEARRAIRAAKEMHREDAERVRGVLKDRDEARWDLRKNPRKSIWKEEKEAVYVDPAEVQLERARARRVLVGVRRERKPSSVTLGSSMFDAIVGVKNGPGRRPQTDVRAGERWQKRLRLRAKRRLRHAGVREPQYPGEMVAPAEVPMESLPAELERLQAVQR